MLKSAMQSCIPTIETLRVSTVIPGVAEGVKDVVGLVVGDIDSDLVFEAVREKL